jgi:hypothetical protein
MKKNNKKIEVFLSDLVEETREQIKKALPETDLESEPLCTIYTMDDDEEAGFEKLKEFFGDGDCYDYENYYNVNRVFHIEDAEEKIGEFMMVHDVEIEYNATDLDSLAEMFEKKDNMEDSENTTWNSVISEYFHENGRL